MKNYLKLLSVPLSFLIIFTTLFLVWKILNLPEQDKLVEIVSLFFDKYGPPALLLSAFLEGILLVGSYFPGVFVIFLGVIVADTPTEAVFSVAVATTGLILAHITNYFLGKYGWYRLLIKFGMRESIENSKNNLEKKGPIAIPLSYWLPSIGALTNTAAGILHMPFKTFFKYSALSSVCWYSLVGLIVYTVGPESLSVATGNSGIVTVYVVILIWIVAILVGNYRVEKI